MNEKKHYSIPNNLSKEPYLSVWWMENYEPTAFFMQVSEDENHPIWLKFGDILELIMRGELDSDLVLVDLMRNALKYGNYDVAIMHIKNSIR